MKSGLAQIKKHLGLLTLMGLLSACSAEKNQITVSTKTAFSNENTENTLLNSKPNQPIKHRNLGVIKISSQTQAKLGIESHTLNFRTLPILLKLKGQIEPDFGKQVDISSRILGRVVKIFVHPGDYVKPGQLLAIIDSHEISEMEAELIEAKSHLIIASAQKERENQIYKEQLLRPKSLIEAKSRLSEAQSQLELADSEFSRQESLYEEKISSQRSYSTAKAAYEQAKNNCETAKLNFQREEQLYNNQALLKKDYQLAEAAHEQALRHLDTLRQRLIFHGMSPENVAAVIEKNQISGNLQITAPIAGIITDSDIAIGELVHNPDTIFRIVDLSKVIAKADLPEKDLSLVTVGSLVQVVVPSYPQRTFQGTISFISETISKETHTVAIRAQLNNEDHALKANMSAHILLEGEERTIFACPKSAVFLQGDYHCVLVDNNSDIVIREIIPGAETREYIEVSDGLSPDEKVVIKGIKELLTLKF